MKTLLSLLVFTLLFATLQAADDAPLAKLRAVPFTEVQISDSFWRPRQETNRTASIPVNLEDLVKSGNISNFELAAKGTRTGFQGPVFMDSDVYKALEAASYSLATHPDPALEKRLDDIIAAVAAAQQPDGYVNTYFTVKDPGKRWANLANTRSLSMIGARSFRARFFNGPAAGNEAPAKMGSGHPRVEGPGGGGRVSWRGFSRTGMAMDHHPEGEIH